MHCRRIGYYYTDKNFSDWTHTWTKCGIWSSHSWEIFDTIFGHITGKFYISIGPYDVVVLTHSQDFKFRSL